MGITDTYTTNRRFEEVVKTLEQKWKECYSTSFTTHATQGGATAMRYTDTNHPRWEKINNSLVEFTVQQTTQGMTMLNKVPPGGEYVTALNVERLPANKAKLTWYSWDAFGSGRKDWEKNKQWVDGQNVACR